MRLPPKSAATEKIDLAGHTAALDLPASGFEQALPVDATGTTVEVGGAAVTIADEQNIAVEVSVEDIVVDYIQGRFNSYTIDIDSTEESFDIPERFDDLDGLRITDGRLLVRVYNTARTPFQLDGIFRGSDEKGAEEDLRILERIEAGAETEEVETVLPPYTAQNSNILNFINLPPRRVAFYGQAKLGVHSVPGGRQDGDHRAQRSG
jgi:hypothetical protein